MAAVPGTVWALASALVMALEEQAALALVTVPAQASAAPELDSGSPQLPG